MMVALEGCLFMIHPFLFLPQISLKDKEITKIIANAAQVVTVTVMPTFLFDHMMKKMSASMVKEQMDHSIPDF